MLDIDSGLVAGIPPRDMDKTIRIRVKRAFYYKGELQPVGKEFDYPYGLAVEAIYGGKAEKIVPKAPEPEPEPPPKAPAKKAKE